MSLVLDASLTLSWYFEDETTEGTQAVLEQVKKEGAVVPMLWPLEVVNGLQMAIRRKRISVAYRDDALERLGYLSIEVDNEKNIYVWSTIPSLAQRFGLTAYDAAYLELANRRTLPLATLDRNLRSAASALGVRVLAEAG